MPGKADICLKQSKLEYGEYAKGVMRNHSVFFFCTKYRDEQNALIEIRNLAVSP